MHRLFFTLFLVVLIVGGCSTDPQRQKQAHVRSGDAYAIDKKLPEAILEYRNAIAADPRDADVRQKLARIYEATGNVANAFREYVRIADLLPHDPDAQVKAGNMLLVARRFEDAQTRAQNALEQAPNHVDAQILRANALVGLNRLDDAVADLEEAVRMDPNRSASYRSLGAMQTLRGNRELAEATFKKAIALEPQSARPHLSLANFYLATGRRDDAQVELKAALDLDSGNALANRTIAYLYMGSGREPEAEPYFRKLAELMPDGSGQLWLANYLLATRREAEGRTVLENVAAQDTATALQAKVLLASLAGTSPDESERLVGAVLTKEPRHVEALIVRAEQRLRSGRLDEALAAARSAAEADARSAFAYLTLGKVLEARREPQEAITAFNQALQTNPRLGQADLELAKLHLESARLSDAQQFAQKAVTKLADPAEARLLLVRIYVADRQPEKAAPHLQTLLNAFPNSPTILTQAGLLALVKRDRAAARAAFERALAKDGSHIPALAELTRLDVEEKRTDAALARVKAAVNRSPKDVQLQVLASDLYAMLKDFDRAERALLVAIEADPNNLDTYWMLARLYARRQQLPEATAQLEAVIQRQPNNVGAYILAGVLDQMQRRPAGARAKYEQALDIDPQAAVAANNLAWMYAEEGGNLDRALQLAQTAKSALPHRPEVNDTLAWVYHKKGLSSIAIPWSLEAVKANPDNAGYRYHLGAIYKATGDWDKARETLNRALALNPRPADADQILKVLASVTIDR